MRTYTINLNTIQKIRDFNTIVAHYDSDIIVKHGRYVIDGKSIQGLFSLSLNENVTLEVNGRPGESMDRLEQQLREAGIIVED